jgi:hypothetical protein
MWEILIWLYLSNAIMLIIHELDSVYWKEWELFHLPGGINGFLIMHIPFLFVILLGLVEVSLRSLPGLFYSFILCLGGIFAFVIHNWLIRIGKPGFKTWMSTSILWMLLMLSIAQLVITINLITS